MGEIDLPGLKDRLWHKMRDDLVSLVPWFADNDLLLCPTCCRAFKYEGFSLEHIIPQQALAEDPALARAAVPKNERSGMTLLCNRTLVFEKKSIPGQGCNNWKGKHYDRFIREALRPDVLKKQFHARHHMALVAAGYLGLFREYGYQIALLPTGLLMRMQFFNPNSFLKEFPVGYQMVLTGEGRAEYDEEARAYWSEPFKTSIDRDVAHVVMRNFSIMLPLSRDPKAPLARALRYAPPRFKFRPDLTTAFD
ncbi:hypothetical protein [Methylobacterium thuringiense]|uniref:HNH endonuclease n=1 Tax=Methylobacterium thuringiense TaxID=1003091 RepID=A0ABQ4TPL5_9HYPH|nr:hypothetical protein [Methylobacterium thuringiense]GJE57310.1 hypothetical protein EKPJFOCH_3824 [Methylobacterium thuringiense]